MGLLDPRRPVALQNTRFQAAVQDFHRARQRAALEQIVARLSGKSAELLSYEDVARRLKVTGQTQSGQRPIPLQAIVGSVGRYSDFTRSFLPRRAADEQRWARVKAAATHVAELPPIEVYQIGEAYFVLDGNHRVSVARQQGVSHIDAYVTEIKTRVGLSPEDQPDEIILKAEYAAFLAYTRLDRLRPEADLRASVPGQYAHLENLIEVHRYFVEEAETRELPFDEAVSRWYDEAYLPVIYAVREQGILRYFPPRTEADFYIWAATHQAQLRDAFGWQVGPAVAVREAARRVQEVPERLTARVWQKFVELLVPERWRSRPGSKAWSKEKVLARYGQSLFADLLVPLADPVGEWPALEQALEVAGQEDAAVHGLHIVPDGETLSPAEAALLQEAFAGRCAQAGVSGDLVFAKGDVVDIVAERAGLTDLVVLARGLIAGREEDRLQRLLRRSPRPVLVVTKPVFCIERALLVWENGSSSGEALFAAAYLAERQGVALVVLSEEEGNGPSLSYVRRYLEMHEIEATFIRGAELSAEAIVDAAADHEADLVVIGPFQRRLGQRVWNEAVTTGLEKGDRLLLFTT